MPLTVVLNIEDTAAVAKETMAEAKDEKDMVDVATQDQPQLTASTYLIPIALLLHKNGIHLVQGDLLFFSYERTDKDMDWDEAVTRLAKVMEMIISAMFLLLTAMTHPTRRTMPPLPPLQLTAVAVMVVDLVVAHIQTTAPDSLGHWQ